MPDQAPLAVFPPCRLARDNEYARRSFPTDEHVGHDKKKEKNRISQAKKAQGKSAYCSAFLITPKAPSCQPLLDYAGQLIGLNALESIGMELLLKLSGVISSQMPYVLIVLGPVMFLKRHGRHQYTPRFQYPAQL
jgi:hypothetical protein